MTDSFNLLDRPWLPCELFDGSVVELPTRDALARAHQLRGLADPSPLVLAVLHRHLLALLHCSYQGPRSLKEWKAIAQAGAFDMDRVGAYLSRVRDRMDLFHPTQPFAQTRGLKEQFDWKPIDEFTTEGSNWGSGQVLFQARTSAKPTMVPAAAARALLVQHGFAAGGLVKKPGEPTAATASPLVRGAVVLLRGRTLFQTLLSNLLVYDPSNGRPIPSAPPDLPSWEQDTPPPKLPLASEPTRMPRGWLDLLTWLSRRIELVREEGLIVGFVLAVWQGFPKEALIRDPMIAYKTDDKNGVRSIGINPDRAFWRDANALFQAKQGSENQPKNIQQAASPDIDDLLAADAPCLLEIHGLAAEKSRLDATRTERVIAARRHFNNPDARDVVERALRFAEDSVAALRSALWSYASKMLSEGNRTPDTKDVRAFVDSRGAEPAVWSALGLHFDAFLRALDDNEKAFGAFAASTRRTVKEGLQDAMASADGTARSLRARAFAERSLNINLPRLPAQPQETAHGEA